MVSAAIYMCLSTCLQYANVSKRSEIILLFATHNWYAVNPIVM